MEENTVSKPFLPAINTKSLTTNELLQKVMDKNVSSYKLNINNALTNKQFETSINSIVLTETPLLAETKPITPTSSIELELQQPLLDLHTTINNQEEHNNSTKNVKLNNDINNIIADRNKTIKEQIRQMNILSVKIAELTNTKKLLDTTHTELVEYLVNKKNDIRKTTLEIDLIKNSTSSNNSNNSTNSNSSNNFNNSTSSNNFGHSNNSTNSNNFSNDFGNKQLNQDNTFLSSIVDNNMLSTIETQIVDRIKNDMEQSNTCSNYMRILASKKVRT